MHREFAIAVLVAASVFCPSIQAQMRGGSRMSGRPVASGMRAPHFGMMGGPRPGMIPPHRVFVGPNRFGHPGAFFPPQFRHGNRFGFVGFRHHHHLFFRNSCFGPFFDPFLCQGGFFASPVIWPGPIFWPDSSNAYAGDSYYAPQAAQAQPSDVDLREDIDRLTREVEMLRQEQQARNTPQQTAGPAPSSAPEQSTVLVFRDGRRAEIQNYGVVGQTLWIFSDKRARKLALTDLNLKATQEANAERGVEFLSGK